MNRNLMLAAAALITATSATAEEAKAGAPDIEAGKTKATTICVACHGVTGKAIMPIYPNIGGQNEAYLISSLKAYKAGERKGGQAAAMEPMAKMLSEQDIINLAAYYSSQK
ncbi:cytochrome c [uncultured Shewanella sp.]|uniref:c-type cytochrome n=1 Tax=uncultured Shewanella sp. TaxID=173975 RepID=UPI0026311867|nr:cytochrome c [uncultured Shewanella sp.]